jgi:hypothetical protein
MLLVGDDFLLCSNSIIDLAIIVGVDYLKSQPAIALNLGGGNELQNSERRVPA